MKHKPTEWRVVCRHYPTPGHKRHEWSKNTEAKAKQSVVDLDHHSEMHTTLWYVLESPYRVQTREVSEWTDAEVSP